MTATRDRPGVEEFARLADPFRRELMAHCYRMLGSVHDAEDLVQETYLRAWRAYDRFEGRSALRTWLYRIATRACLTALESRARRPMPAGLGAPSADPAGDLVERPEVPWLEPVPDELVGADDADPAAVVVSRESIRLAFVAALQHLSPRQRAVLVLREVLQWKAAEVAEVLGCSTAAVNSLLQRARAQLAAAGVREDDVLPAPDSPEAQELLDRYIAAFESYDIDKLVELFTADAVWEMPPFDSWYRGPHDIVLLSKTHCPAEGPGDLRFIRTTANGQPAAAVYLLNRETGRHEPLQLQVFDIGADGIRHVVAFHLPSFEKWGLPAVWEAPGA